MRSALQDLVGPAQLAVFPFELADALDLVGRGAGALTPVDLGLDDPTAQGLGIDVELPGDVGDEALSAARVR